MVQHAVFPRIVGYRLRDADADIDDILFLQLPGGAPADDPAGRGLLPPARGEGLDPVRPGSPFRIGDLKAAGEGRQRLVAPARLHHHDGVHQTARNDGVARTGRHVHRPVHLHDHDAAVGLHRLADRQRVAGHEHVVEGDVALGVCGGN